MNSFYISLYSENVYKCVRVHKYMSTIKYASQGNRMHRVFYSIVVIMHFYMVSKCSNVTDWKVADYASKSEAIVS